MEENKNALVALGLKIKNLRENLGLTQEELGRMVGYTSRSSINKVESGDVDLPRSKIIAFAKALKTTPAYLMGWEKEPESEPQLNPRTVILAREAGTLTEEQIEFVEGLIKQFKDKNGIE